MIFKFINFLFILQKPYLSLTQKLKKRSSFRRKRRTEEEPNPSSRKDLYLKVSKISGFLGYIRPTFINIGYCSGTCAKEPKSLRQTVFNDYSEYKEIKNIKDVKEFLGLEEGCCIPKSYHRTSFYDPNIKYGEKVENFNNLKVKSCYCFIF